MLGLTAGLVRPRRSRKLQSPGWVPSTVPILGRAAKPQAMTQSLMPPMAPPITPTMTPTVTPTMTQAIAQLRAPRQLSR
jgi:hypothetical protein